MKLAYDLHVRFQEGLKGAALGGNVTVTLREPCTCRELLVRPLTDHAGGAGFGHVRQALVCAESVEWREGETYTYPFSFNTDSVSVLEWGVVTQVHRVGERDADPAQVWHLAQQAQTPVQPPLQSRSEGQPELTLLDQSFASVRSLVHDVSITFDKARTDYCYGEEITGTIIFTPAWDLVDHRMGLDYQWRTYGQTEDQRGAHRPISIALEASWQAEKHYRVPFGFTIPSAPRLSRGNGQKLYWHVWPVLLPLDGSTQGQFLQAEAKLHLQPHAGTRSRGAPTSQKTGLKNPGKAADWKPTLISLSSGVMAAIYRAIAGALLGGGLMFFMALYSYLDETSCGLFSTCAAHLWSWDAIWDAVGIYVIVGAVVGAILSVYKDVNTAFHRGLRLSDDIDFDFDHDDWDFDYD